MFFIALDLPNKFIESHSILSYPSTRSQNLLPQVTTAVHLTTPFKDVFIRSPKYVSVEAESETLCLSSFHTHSQSTPSHALPDSGKQSIPAQQFCSLVLTFNSDTSVSLVLQHLAAYPWSG